MKIEDIISKYNHIRLAKSNDGQAIVDFLKSIPMKFGNISVRYDFEDSIWKFLNYQGEKAYVFLVVENNKICGYGVISVRDYYILGERHRAGYLSDLRVSPQASREAKHQWKESVNDLFSNVGEIEEFKDVSYFYAAVFDKNIKALKLFNNEKFPLIFNPLLKYQAISILGRKPIQFLKPQKASNNFIIARGTKEDELALKEFLYQQNIKKLWGEYYEAEANDKDEWARRKSCWNNFNVEDFFIGKNKDGKIVFTTLPWAPQKTRKLVVEEIDRFYIVLGKLFKLVGKKALTKHSPLSNYYLTHFEISHDLSYEQKKEIFTNFLNQLYKTNFWRQYHSVIFCDYYDEAVNQVLNDYIVIKTKASLYQILPKKNQEKIIKDSGDKVPQMTFEAAIV